MVQLLTTYRHDYITPVTTRYKFKESKPEKSPKEYGDVCDSCKQTNMKKSTIPEAKVNHLKMEWTGIAPMGRLIEPRIIPPDSDSHLGRSYQTKIATNKCIEDQPNKFLKVLEQCYPDLYERLKQMPDNDLKRRLNVEIYKTTYQIDYCRMPEFPVGIYHKKSIEEDENNKRMTVLQDGCDQFKKDVNIKLNSDSVGDSCKNVRRKKTDLQSASIDDSSHWVVGNEFTNKPRVTEYMDNLSRTGCIIKKNEIHDHGNCGDGEKCLHKLKKQCRTFK